MAQGSWWQRTQLSSTTWWLIGRTEGWQYMQSLRASWSLADIPERRSPVPPRSGTISAVRSRTDQGTAIGLWIPAADVTGLTVTLSHPDDGDLQRTWSRPR